VEKFTDDDDFIEIDCSPTKFDSGSEDEDGFRGQNAKLTNFLISGG